MYHRVKNNDYYSSISILNFFSQIRELKVKNDPSCTSELFALACGPSYTAVLVDSCVVNGVKFNVHNRDLRRSTQNSGISTPNPRGGMFYGQLEEIIELEYIPFKVVLFKVKWFDTNNDGRIKRCTHRNNITQIMTDRVSFESEPYILATQATQVFYLDFPGKRGNFKAVQDSYHRKIWNPDIIVVEDNQDVVHDNTSSHVTLSAELDTLNYNTINRDVEPAEVVAPPQPIITDVDDDDNDIDYDDHVPHDLASDGEDHDDREDEADTNNEGFYLSDEGD